VAHTKITINRFFNKFSEYRTRFDANILEAAIAEKRAFLGACGGVFLVRGRGLSYAQKCVLFVIIARALTPTPYKPSSLRKERFWERAGRGFPRV
jgi:hypothetical protein